MQKWLKWVSKITSTYDCKDVYNLDETALFYGIQPDRTTHEHQSRAATKQKPESCYILFQFGWES
jgi:hypothetical protein